jgi:hypothetical protein
MKSPQYDSIGQAFEMAIARIFALTRSGSRIRGVIIRIAFLSTWIITAFWYHPWSDWSVLLFPIPLDTAASPTGMLVLAIDHFLGFFLAGDTLTRLITFFTPAWLAIEFASIYLMDIFELPKASIGRNFITRTAFAFPKMERLVISSEELSGKQKDSPVIRIGGPSRVQVNLEYAAVFEKINGTFHPISPNLRIQTHVKSFSQRFTELLSRIGLPIQGADGHPASKVTEFVGKPKYLPVSSELDGFERLRKIIDLRDQTMSFSVEARTSDGIHVTVKDVHMIFSVWRGVDQTSIGRPYPVRRQAIYWLTYQNNPGDHWPYTMKGLVQEEFVRFINEHTLGELLAAIGEPEIQRQLSLEAAIQRKIWSHRRHARSRRMRLKQQLPRRPQNFRKGIPLPYREKDQKHARRPRFQRFYSATLAQFPKPPNFIPRPQLSNFFRDFTSGFPERARLQGVRLEWIDIGSFSTDEQVILNQHIEAWRTTAENLLRSSNRILEELHRQSTNQEITRMLQAMPILSFIQLQRQNTAPEDTIFTLVGMYKGILQSARENLLKQGKPVPASLENALGVIRKYQHEQYKQRLGRYI